MSSNNIYPTTHHEEVSNYIIDMFSKKHEVEAVILTCSCARGKGVRDIDFSILTAPDINYTALENLQNKWEKTYKTESIFCKFRKLEKFYQVDLCFTDGKFKPKITTLTDGPDNYELNIGNTFVYTIPLWKRGNYFNNLKDNFLPYYNDGLQNIRLKEGMSRCEENITFIEWFVKRKLHFQAYNRLYIAVRYFIQTLFINNRKYPIAYDKWLKEQFEEILDFKDLYPKVLNLFEIEKFQSEEIIKKGKNLESMFTHYLKQD